MLGKRLEHLFETTDKQQAELAAYLNVSEPTVSQWKTGKREPSLEILNKISEFFGCSTDYLLGRTNVPTPLKEIKSITVPLLGVIRAGIPLLAEENWIEEIEVPTNLQADFALRITGDSMSWVGIHDGDLAILRKIDIPSHGMIVAAGVEDVTWEATLKYFVKENGKPVLRAANPSYEDIVITPKHRIIGHVVAILKEPPTLQHYTNIIISKEIMDEQWKKIIEKATQKGMDGEKVAKLIELFADMAKKF